MKMLIKRIDKEFDNFWNGISLGPWSNISSYYSGWAPQIDVSHDDEKFTLEAELPGVDSEDVEINIEENVLTLKGEKKEMKKEGKNYCRTERYLGSFIRSFTLPDIIDKEKVEATFDKGILTITIPKHPKQVPKKIKISINK
jgi:HSP20 family protein